MTLTFKDLEALAQQDIDFLPSRALATQAQQYQSAPLDEILELLESAQEIYRHLRSTLPKTLRQSLEIEIEFFSAIARSRYNARSRQRNFSPQHRSA